MKMKKKSLLLSSSKQESPAESIYFNLQAAQRDEDYPPRWGEKEMQSRIRQKSLLKSTVTNTGGKYIEVQTARRALQILSAAAASTCRTAFFFQKAFSFSFFFPFGIRIKYGGGYYHFAMGRCIF
ncbi:hypothetical protein PGT21_036024 [Puccinia graminis f. sp. tritici]|uniref:Uncharacterized protein n=1 Tax=Puccinia graminis f. sp. tritici TaxID=56615 RepID=A0A5B0P0Q7_PUCGR|nr:hypothetical protein PGT21_036024 [Puccinia graminis f. sp. tritici]